MVINQDFSRNINDFWFNRLTVKGLKVCGALKYNSNKNTPRMIETVLECAVVFRPETFRSKMVSISVTALFVYFFLFMI